MVKRITGVREGGNRISGVCFSGHASAMSGALCIESVTARLQGLVGYRKSIQIQGCAASR